MRFNLRKEHYMLWNEILRKLVKENFNWQGMCNGGPGVNTENMNEIFLVCHEILKGQHDDEL